MLQSSRESLTRTLEDVRTAVAGSDARVLGTELLAVVSTLVENPELRRRLGDPAVANTEKTAVVDAVLSAHISVATRGVLLNASARRWAKIGDFVTGLEIAGVTAVAEAAETAGVIARVEREIFEFERVVSTDHELEWAFESLATPETKGRLVRDLLEGRASEFTVILVEQAATHPRGLRVAEVLDHYTQTLAARTASSIADVTVAKPLDASQEDRLAAALSKRFGRKLALNIHVDPSVVGGVKARVGDELIDSTVADRLTAVHRQLAS